MITVSLSLCVPLHLLHPHTHPLTPFSFFQDFEAFENAVEMEELEAFLKL